MRTLYGAPLLKQGAKGDNVIEVGHPLLIGLEGHLQGGAWAFYAVVITAF